MIFGLLLGMPIGAVLFGIWFLYPVWKKEVEREQREADAKVAKVIVECLRETTKRPN